MRRSIFESGYFAIPVARLGGRPIRIHWTAPIGLFLLSGCSLNPLAWACILLVVVVHELGHVLLARRYGLSLVSVDITGIGGVCRLEGDPTLSEAAVVAWGGVLAQAALLVAALVLRPLLHVVAFGLVDGALDALITDNAVLIALNLLPVEPLDGATAWRLFRR